MKRQSAMLQDLYGRGLTHVETPSSYVLPGGCGVFLIRGTYRLVRVAVGHPTACDGLWSELYHKHERVPWRSVDDKKAAIAGLQRGQTLFLPDEVELLIEWILPTPAFKKDDEE